MCNLLTATFVATVTAIVLLSKLLMRFPDYQSEARLQDDPSVRRPLFKHTIETIEANPSSTARGIPVFDTSV
jgi:hypothetical protein